MFLKMKNAICELMNKHASIFLTVVFVRKFANGLLKFIFWFLNVKAFRSSFSKLRDSFKAFGCFLAFLSLPFISNADQLQDSLNSIENSISNLSAKVDLLASQIDTLSGSLGGSSGGGLSNSVSQLQAAVDEFFNYFKASVGKSPATISNRMMYLGQKALSIENLLTSANSSLNAISNLLSAADFEFLQNILRELNTTLYWISDDTAMLVSSLWEMQAQQQTWSNIHTNLLLDILEKINTLANITNVVNYGGGDAGTVSVEVRGVVDVGDLQLNIDDLWDFSFSFSVEYLRYNQQAAGLEEWGDDLLSSYSNSIEDSGGGDFRQGVMVGMQAIADISAQNLEATHRILLSLHSSNSFEDVKRDFEDKGQQGEEQSDMLRDTVAGHVDSLTALNWREDLSSSVSDMFYDFKNVSFDGADRVVFTFPGGDFLGFTWETFQVDCSDVLNSEISDFIRAWCLFFYSATLLFLVLRFFPVGLARFATITYFLANINKKLG